VVDAVATTVANGATYDSHTFTKSDGVTVLEHICTWDGLIAISRKIPNCYDADSSSSTA